MAVADERSGLGTGQDRDNAAANAADAAAAALVAAAAATNVAAAAGDMTQTGCIARSLAFESSDWTEHYPEVKSGGATGRLGRPHRDSARRALL
jgi:hypothetical protein